MSVLDNHDVVYMARRAAKRIMSINLAVGSRLPAHATSMGKVLLAYLPPHELEHYLESVVREPLTANTIVDDQALRAVLEEVRENGWAVADEESELGVRSVAAPLVGRDGEVCAAINVAAHAARVSLDQLQRDYLPGSPRGGTRDLESARREGRRRQALRLRHSSAESDSRGT